MNPGVHTRVEQACQRLLAADQPVTFDEVARRAGIGRATLYRRPELRAVIDEHRQTRRDALTLTDIATQVDQLRATLQALADKVRRHDEQLGRLQRGDSPSR
jgi:AcrR family transcriptional regulator